MSLVHYFVWNVNILCHSDSSDEFQILDEITILLFAVNIVLTTIPCLVNTEGLMLK
jgi:hypothetical protein